MNAIGRTYCTVTDSARGETENGSKMSFLEILQGAWRRSAGTWTGLRRHCGGGTRATDLLRTGAGDPPVLTKAARGGEGALRAAPWQLATASRIFGTARRKLGAALKISERLQSSRERLRKARSHSEELRAAPWQLATAPRIFGTVPRKLAAALRILEPLPGSSQRLRKTSQRLRESSESL